MAKRQVESITIAHLSDLHAGSQYFVSNLLSRAVQEINELGPDVVVVTGDLTEQGFRQEYKTARAFLDLLDCSSMIVVPGNHDSRHVGYLHFEELFGLRNSFLKSGDLCIVGVDSSEPDLDDGRIGRERYGWIKDNFKSSRWKILAIHHHLLPVPGTGRERNIIYDAGDLLQVLTETNVNVVLSGHKHVPFVWRLENLLVINAGTVSSLRLRGHTKPCYNVLKVEDDTVWFFRKYPYGEQELITKAVFPRQPKSAEKTDTTAAKGVALK